MFTVLPTLFQQGRSGTIFDNFLITNDEKYAEDAGNEMWGATYVSDCIAFHKSKNHTLWLSLFITCILFGFS